MEGIILIDVLRRAGVEVIVAGLTPGPILASRGTKHLADVELADVADQDFDLIVLPGGAVGAKNLEADATLAEMLRRHRKNDNAYIGAICAAPNVLRNLKILGENDPFTLHPATIDTGSGGRYVNDQRVVRAGRVWTSVGPGSAFEFALELVEELCGREKREAVAAPMFLPAGQG